MPGQSHLFYDCPTCRGIFRPRAFLPDPTFEKHRYELHQNDPTDSGYRKFVEPLCVSIIKDFSANAKGLDFGSGTNSAVSAVLLERGYDIAQYDPFFFADAQALEKRYDYIACCEVMEHFHTPDLEFGRLNGLLNEGGRLYCMTHIYEDEMEFSSWYYKNDPTHVFIYRRQTIGYIKEAFGFKGFTVENRLITLRK